MPTLTVDFHQLRGLTATGLTVEVTQHGQPIELVIQGVTLDDLANFAAAEHLR